VQVSGRCAGQPFFADLSQDRGDETQAGSRIGKDRKRACSAADFAMQAFHAIGGTQQTPEGGLNNGN